MKYTNKHTITFKKTWHKLLTGPRGHEIDDIKRWARLNGSDKRFFYKVSLSSGHLWTVYEIYFEDELDATLFALRWL